jgi:hypothetical protein
LKALGDRGTWGKVVVSVKGEESAVETRTAKL